MTNLPENIDATYPDRSPGDAAHQQHHDALHGDVYNVIDDAPDDSLFVKKGGVLVPVGRDTFQPALNASSYVTGDGATDDSTGLASAASDAVSQGRTLFIPADLTVSVDSTVDLTAVPHLRCEGKLRSNVTGSPGFLIGGESSSTDPRVVHIAEAIHSGTPSRTQPTVRVQGCKTGQITVVKADWVQLHADGIDAAKNSLAYSTLYAGKITTLEIFVEDANGTAWVNENTIVGGRFTDVIIDGGTFRPNGNVFLHPKIEGSGSGVTISSGHSNHFQYVRGESGTAVTFGTGTFNNRVIAGYRAAASTTETPFTVTNDGDASNRVEFPAAQPNEVVFDVADMYLSNAEPSRELLAGNDSPEIWLMTTSPGNPAIGGDILLPEDWVGSEIVADVEFTNASSGSGEVQFRFDWVFRTDGATLDGGLTIGTAVAHTAPAQYDLDVVEQETGISVTGRRLQWRLFRQTTVDSLAGNAAVLRVTLRKAA